MKKSTYLVLGSCLVMQTIPFQSSGFAGHAGLRDNAVTDIAPILSSKEINAAARIAARRNQASELLGAASAAAAGIGSQNMVELSMYVNRRTRELLPQSYRSHSRQVARAITQQSERFGMDPLFVMALIRRESRFNPAALGTHGEIGLMQMKPSTALWLLEQGEQTGYTGPHEYEQVRNALKDPVLNIAFGTAYLARLRTDFKGRGSLYVAAYNMGALALKSSLRTGVRPNTYSDFVITEYKALGADFARSSRQINTRQVASLSSGMSSGLTAGLTARPVTGSATTFVRQ